MSKSILWYQHQDPKQDDVISFNGEILTDKNDIQEKFQIINYLVNETINKRAPWCGMVKGYFFMKGYLNSKDNIGRAMSFLYATDQKDYKISCIEELKARGFQMSADSEKCLCNKTIYTSLKRIVFFLLILFIAICVCIVTR